MVPSRSRSRKAWEGGGEGKGRGQMDGYHRHTRARREGLVEFGSPELHTELLRHCLELAPLDEPFACRVNRTKATVDFLQAPPGRMQLPPFELLPTAVMFDALEQSGSPQVHVAPLVGE